MHAAARPPPSSEHRPAFKTHQDFGIGETVVNHSNSSQSIDYDADSRDGGAPAGVGESQSSTSLSSSSSRKNDRRAVYNQKMARRNAARKRRGKYFDYDQVSPTRSTVKWANNVSRRLLLLYRYHLLFTFSLYHHLHHILYRYHHLHLSVFS